MQIVFSRAALNELDGIWDWNLDHWGRDQAAKYQTFLEDGIAELATNPQNSIPLKDFPGLRKLILKWRLDGDGHVVIFRQKSEELVEVLHIYHTKQDISGRLKRELN